MPITSLHEGAWLLTLHCQFADYRNTSFYFCLCYENVL